MHFFYGLYKLLNTLIMWLPFSFIRTFWCRIILKKIGKKTFLSRNIDIRSPRKIFIGNHCVINKHCILDGRGASLIIHDNVDIAQDVQIWTQEHDINSSNHSLKSLPVEIEENVWIASRATILPGVKIGKGAVIACGAVVTKNVSPYTIVAGIPAKEIGKRNEQLKYTLKHFPFFE